MNKRQRKKAKQAATKPVVIKSYSIKYAAPAVSPDDPKWAYRCVYLPATTDGDAWYRWATAPPKSHE